MESVKPSSVAPRKSKLARTFAKVLHLRALTGIAQTEGQKKVKTEANLKDEGNSLCRDMEAEELQERLAAEALLAKVFASISFVKASYAQLQFAQSPYDPDGIEAADKLVVSELKNLSELKQCYLKKQSDPSPDTAILAAELKELQSVNKTFEIMGKKLESQVRLKESEIIFLKEKLEEATKHNRLIEKRLNQSGSLSMLENLHVSGLSSSHFVTVIRHTVRSIRSFVRLIVDEMRSVGWDIDASVNAIHPNIVFWKEDHKCFAIESFVCREMFDSFHFPSFSIPNENPPDRNNQQKLFFEGFNELKLMKAKEFLSEKPRSPFAKFCRIKYLRLVHPKMEYSFFGNLRQRDLLNAGEFPYTSFFTSFAEMAKRVWLLHCLAFSFEPQASIFQVKKGCRFSEVYMECVNDDDSSDHTQVAFAVVPGFRIGKTIIQCQVYLSQSQSKVVKEKYTSTKQR
ncbi:protein GRAVITROPIC IN THE LIGHT 1 [Prosopis cineraria]|uniref:protein GRAVITROPIC IN THE LIGHT 1 n=1 Tax=Prosopis cineraria TaxID=364024 RepID=UPI00240F5770|nr:protein GRAVITROPIC IN THE LIGHT 1 [Prosopis cineraria]XP_054815918.1 protein GRAVITROPIC IN THE LIGHT 1 [Prosopis cineraria]XP_054815919.1 protein GRAVITROPIC IN THE LIGHT 1 [Prosopis cineraria]XP_054815920.1 protein GRAVITROPIC IN THE LIGHT 1 [Prosopis cineraria]XP_054815921.1 protein GRAVITROPIC IN THE LIGHT 1 [Prosopis cineraria]XP_054815922.1 protein GRAVITROPIC IN THE LIGHT 1 [Prosopis cineraria]